MRISFVVYDGYFEKCSKMVNLVINHYDGGYQVFFEKKVTAVFAVSDFYALEFMRFLQSKGIQIPKDILIKRESTRKL